MRFPDFLFRIALFGRDRTSARPSSRFRRRRDVKHRLAAESLEDRAVLAVVVPVPRVTGVIDVNSVALRSGGVTNAAPLTISGTVAPGVTTVTVFNGNIPVPGALTFTPGSKTWSFETATMLPDGIYNFRARATVGAMTSAASASAFKVTVDSVAPAPPTISNVLDDRAPVVGTVPRSGSTNDRTLTLTGTAEPGSRVDVFADFNGSGSPQFLGIARLVGSTWRFTTTPLVPDASCSFTAKATDKAGNTSIATLSPYVVSVDTGETTPTIVSIIDNVGTVQGDVLGPPLSGLTNDTTLEIRGTADVGSTVRVYDGKTLLGTTVANNGNWTFSTRPLTNGQTYRFASQGMDAAGNTSAMSAPLIPILIDTSAPWRPLITGVTANTAMIVNRGVTNQTTLTISGRSEPGSTVDLYDGNILIGPGLPVNPSGEWSFVTTPLIDGVHAFAARANDAAGNMSVLPSVTYSVTVDTTAPAIPTIDAAVDAVEPNLGVISGPTNDTRPVLFGTTAIGTVVRIYDGPPGPGTFLGLAEVTGTTWTFRPTSPLLDGVHVFNATAIDVAGNESNPNAYAITVDTSAAALESFGTQPTAGTYEFGDVVYIDLQFDEAVIVDTTDGTPRIALNTVPERFATYDSGSGTDTLVFKFEPQLGDKATALDFAPAVIDLNGGTIRDSAGNDVDPTLDSLVAANRIILVDAKLTILPIAPPPDLLSPGPILTTPLPALTIRFNAPLTRDLTVDSFDLFLEDRSMSTAGVIIAKLTDDTYSLTLPSATHQSLRGRYRLDIGGPDSGIESGGVLMDTIVSLYWQLQ